jgi:hypothetical protein
VATGAAVYAKGGKGGGGGGASGIRCLMPGKPGGYMHGGVFCTCWYHLSICQQGFMLGTSYVAGSNHVRWCISV